MTIAYALYSSHKRTFVRDFPTIEDYEQSPDCGSGDLLVEVEELGYQHYKLAATQYYSKSGVFEMTITQPLDRALRTFAAALAMDTKIEISQ